VWCCRKASHYQAWHLGATQVINIQNTWDTLGELFLVKTGTLLLIVAHSWLNFWCRWHCQLLNMTWHAFHFVAVYWTLGNSQMQDCCVLWGSYRKHKANNDLAWISWFSVIVRTTCYIVTVSVFLSGSKLFKATVCVDNVENWLCT